MFLALCVCVCGTPCVARQCATANTCDILPVDTWVHRYLGANVDDVPILHKYTMSVYFINFTIFTVGYGDIVPQNYAERIFICVVLVVSSLVHATIFGNITVQVGRCPRQCSRPFLRRDFRQ